MFNLYGGVSHDPEIVSRLNKAMVGLNPEAVLMELTESYFDDEDLKEITKFIEERFTK